MDKGRNTHSACWPGRQLPHGCLQKAGQEYEKSASPGRGGVGGGGCLAQTKTAQTVNPTGFAWPLLFGSLALKCNI